MRLPVTPGNVADWHELVLMTGLAAALAGRGLGPRTVYVVLTLLLPPLKSLSPVQLGLLCPGAYVVAARPNAGAFAWICVRSESAWSQWSPTWTSAGSNT